MQVQYKKLSEIRPYERNPRRNDGAVDAVAESIRQFGWKVPIVIDSEGVIVTGHTRLKAAKKLGLDSVPCIVADDLTPEQVMAYRLADNKTAELATWDFPALEMELDALSGALDMDAFGFDIDAAFSDTSDFSETESTADGYPESRREDLRPYQPEPEPVPDRDEPPTDWFSGHESGVATDEDSEEYQAFAEKFQPKKTTDDCYTPDNVYDAVAAWVEKEYGVDRACFVRPFYPGGDYQREQYAPDCVVVDNPPFSILTEIVQFYAENGVRFFLFAPTLTLFTARNVKGITYLPLGVAVTYGNGANVSTSFITNLDRYQVRTVPELYKLVEAANDENLRAMHKDLPKYDYPDEVITAVMVARWCKYGVDFRLLPADCQRITELDMQKEHGKSIFGGGYLLSESAAKKVAQAKQTANERVSAMTKSKDVLIWTLSDREKAIVEELGST